MKKPNAAWRLVRKACIGCASMQTAGRGTHGRAWDSPDGAGLYLTRCGMREPLLLDGLTPTVGIALAEAIRAATGVPVCVKPINDLVCDGSNSADFGGRHANSGRHAHIHHWHWVERWFGSASGAPDGWPAASLQDVLPAGQPLPEISERPAWWRHVLSIAWRICTEVVRRICTTLVQGGARWCTLAPKRTAAAERPPGKGERNRKCPDVPVTHPVGR